MKNLARLALVGVGATVLLFAMLTASAPRVHSQKVKPAKKIDQHFLVVPDVAPFDLERQLKLINERGVYIGREDILLVGDKFTIVVFDAAPGDEEESDGR